MLRVLCNSIGYHGCEAWQFTQNNKKIVQSFARDVVPQGPLENAKNQEGESNQQRSARTERVLVSNLMQREWGMQAMYVLRGGELSNLIIEGTIEGTRASGRPRGQWWCKKEQQRERVEDTKTALQMILFHTLREGNDEELWRGFVMKIGETYIGVWVTQCIVVLRHMKSLIGKSSLILKAIFLRIRSQCSRMIWDMPSCFFDRLINRATVFEPTVISWSVRLANPKLTVGKTNFAV